MRGGVVHVEICGGTAIATLVAGCCGKKRRRTMVLPEVQTLEERMVILRRMYPNAEIVFIERVG